MAISVITPRIDYSQGNEFWVTHDNMGSLHVPALDGIGYQDSVNWQRAWWDYKKHQKQLTNQQQVKQSLG